MDVTQLQGLKIKDLTKLAQEMEVPSYSGLKKQELIMKILETSAEKEGKLFASGVLEVMQEGYGFLRSQDYNYLPGPDDIYVSPSQIKRFNLKTGHQVAGQIRPPKDNERFYALLKVETVNNEAPEKVKNTILFDNLTPLYPEKRVNLGKNSKDFSMRTFEAEVLILRLDMTVHIEFDCDVDSPCQRIMSSCYVCLRFWIDSAVRINNPLFSYCLHC